MRAIIQSDPSDPRSLTLGEADTPALQPGEILLKVHAAGVNRGDLVQAQGNYPPPPGASEIIGLEVSGTIADPGDTDYSPGDAVCALLAGGGYAEYVAVPATHLLPIPEGVTLTEAATLPEVACTVWSNLGMLAGLEHGAAGKRVLVHGGASGIGSFAIQLLKALGAEVAVTAGSAEKLDYCRQLGADIALNYREDDFAAELKNSCDVVLDIIGGPYLEDNVRCLAREGQLIIIAMQGGNRSELSLGRAFAKRATIRFSTLRSRPRDAKDAIVASTRQHVWPLIERGTIRPTVAREFPLADAARAHDALDSGTTTGKLVLTA